MIKKRYVITAFTILSLAITLFIGSAIAPTTDPPPIIDPPPVEEPFTQTGYISVPAAAFEPTEHPSYAPDWRNTGGSVKHYDEDDDHNLVAPVHLPDGVTVTNVVFYFIEPYVDSASMEFYLYKTPTLQMAYVDSTEADPEGYVHDDTINFAVIDNSQAAYYLKVLTYRTSFGYVPQVFKYAVIEYEYMTPKYIDASTWIELDRLPGVRINVASRAQYIIPPEETTHVWHGFRSYLWSTQNEDQKTEFLSTAQWHFYVNGEEVSLTHVLQYNAETDYVYSIFYRVFPPRYFEENRNNKLIGEWIAMEDGGWDTTKLEATIRVQ